jgi:hypothetical protein
MDLATWATDAWHGISQSLQHDRYWKPRLNVPPTSVGFHLAVLVEPFLGYILEGRKTVESRFSVNRCAPFQRVSVGDIVLLKSASGPVRGICEVSRTWFFDLRTVPLREIRERFEDALCADTEFWKVRAHAEYATLMGVKAVRPLPPLSCPKRDRRGWVILTKPGLQVDLPVQA